MKIWSPTKVHYYLKLQMLKVAKKERMKCNKKKEVTKFEEIGLSWQQDSSMENCVLSCMARLTSTLTGLNNWRDT